MVAWTSGTNAPEKGKYLGKDVIQVPVESNQALLGFGNPSNKTKSSLK